MRIGWFLLMTVVLTISARASAADVVLVHPPAADSFIDEVFNRVRGELHARAILFEEKMGSEDSAEPTQQSVLQRTRCIVCVFVVWRGDTSLIRVWVNDGSARAPALFEAVALDRNPEVPTLLAARAVDLLVGALRQQRAPAPVTPAVRAVRRAPEASVDDRPHFSRWSLGAGVTEFGAPSPWGAAWGPQVFSAVKVSPWLELGARVAGPLTGASAENAEASAHWSQWLGLLELDAEWARFGPVTFGAVAEAGAHYLDAHGAVAEGVSSIAPAHQTHFTVAVATGIRSAFFLSSRVSLRFDAQALLLVPPPRIAIAGEAVSFREPALELSLGLCSKF